jgi:hypothetical protein
MSARTVEPPIQMRLAPKAKNNFELCLQNIDGLIVKIAGTLHFAVNFVQ